MAYFSDTVSFPLNASYSMVSSSPLMMPPVTAKAFLSASNKIVNDPSDAFRQGPFFALSDLLSLPPLIRSRKVRFLNPGDQFRSHGTSSSMACPPQKMERPRDGKKLFPLSLFFRFSPFLFAFCVFHPFISNSSRIPDPSAAGTSE